MNVSSIASLVMGILGLLVGGVSAVYAIRERMLKQMLDRTLRTVEEAKARGIWTKIGIDCTAFDALDDAKKLVQSRQAVDHEVLAKIENARRSTVDLYRLLLEEAATIERDFSMDTIKRWQKAGRIENEWRLKAAMRLLSTDKIPDCDATASASNTSSIHEKNHV